MNTNVEKNVVKTVAAKTAMNAYEIDHFKCKIYFGRQFMKKANEYGSPEYKTFLGLRSDFPTYKIEIRDNKKSEIRMSMKGLTRAHMEKYMFFRTTVSRLSALTEPTNTITAIRCLNSLS